MVVSGQAVPSDDHALLEAARAGDRAAVDELLAR
jgi:hypothetical protein